MWGLSVILADAVSALLAPSHLNRQEHPADQSFNHSLLDAFIKQSLKLPLQICEMYVGAVWQRIAPCQPSLTENQKNLVD